MIPPEEACKDEKNAHKLKCAEALLDQQKSLHINSVYVPQGSRKGFAENVALDKGPEEWSMDPASNDRGLFHSPASS